MAEWSVQCKICGRVFKVPPGKRPPEEEGEVILQMALPRHTRPGQPDRLCPGSETEGEAQKRET